MYECMICAWVISAFWLGCFLVLCRQWRGICIKNRCMGQVGRHTGTFFSQACVLLIGLKVNQTLSNLLNAQPKQLDIFFGNSSVISLASQGSPEGTPFAITAIHWFVNEALHDHPDPAIKLYGIADALTIMGPIKVITPFFSGHERYFEVCSACWS